MAKSYHEIMLLVMEPMMKGIIAFENKLSKEPDIDTDLSKRALLELVRGWITQYEQFRDGDFEVGNEEDVPHADMDGSRGNSIGLLDPEAADELREQGIDPEGFLGEDEEDGGLMDPESGGNLPEDS